MKSKLLVLCASLLLASCASYVNPNNANEVATGITVSRDEYKKITVYRAPVFKSVRNQGLSQHIGYVHLQAAKQDSTGLVIYGIHVRDTHFQKTWCHLNTAYDINGNRLEVQRMGSDVNCMSATCLFMEDVLVLVSRDYLEQHQNTGIKFQVSGSNGGENYTVSPAYIKAFLAKVPF